MKKPRKTPAYKRAVDWIAFNDEPTIMDIPGMSDLVSVTLVADVFGIAAQEVAKDVIIKRIHEDTNEN